MVDLQMKLTDLREDAYGKVLKCLPYPRQWATELLIAGLRKEFDIEDDVHEEILEAVMTNTERPRKRQKLASSQPYEQSFPQHKRSHNHASYFESEQPASMLGSGGAAAGSALRHSLADKVEQAKQKVKAQGSCNLGPSSRLAAAVAGPIKAKKRKIRTLQERTDSAAPTYKQAQSAQPQIRQLTEDEIAQGCKLDPCIGMRLQRLWPEDGGWFEGVVTDYSALDKTHCITYNFNTNDESFEWYDLRNRNPEECKLLKGKVDVLSKGVQQQQQPPPAQHNNNNASNGAKPARKPGQGFGRGAKKGPGRHSAGGGRGGHSQRVAPYQPPHVSHQPPTAHKFQVVSSDDDDYGGGGSDEDVSDDGDY